MKKGKKSDANQEEKGASYRRSLTPKLWKETKESTFLKCKNDKKLMKKHKEKRNNKHDIKLYKVKAYLT